MLFQFTNIQLDDFSATLRHLLECLSIEEPEGQEWTMMAAVNVGALLEYGWPQGILRCTGTLGQVGRTPATTTAAMSKAQVDDRMEVNGDDRRWSSDVEGRSPLSLIDLMVYPTFQIDMHQDI